MCFPDRSDFFRVEALGPGHTRVCLGCWNNARGGWPARRGPCGTRHLPSADGLRAGSKYGSGRETGAGGH
jgi:hypothetical protein